MVIINNIIIYIFCLQQRFIERLFQEMTHLLVFEEYAPTPPTGEFWKRHLFKITNI
jgi:hypothetical protein